MNIKKSKLRGQKDAIHWYLYFIWRNWKYASLRNVG